MQISGMCLLTVKYYSYYFYPNLYTFVWLPSSSYMGVLLEVVSVNFDGSSSVSPASNHINLICDSCLAAYF